MRSAKDVMVRKFKVIKSADSIQKACAMLIRNKISGAPVVDKAGKLVGFISEKDIIRLLSHSQSTKKSVSDIMVTKIKSVKESSSIELISRIFSQTPFRRIPVTSDGKLVGIVNRADVMDKLLHEYY